MLEIRRICIRRRLALRSRSRRVFDTSPCKFASFQAAIRSLPFGLMSYNFLLYFANILPLFLSPISISHQVPSLVINNRKGF